MEQQMNGMMPNGMPPQGQQMNGMQRPQQNNIMQQVHAKILNDMKNGSAEFVGKWQAMHDMRDRAQRIMQLMTMLRLLEGNVQKCLATAQNFELTTIRSSPNKEFYTQQMDKKLQDIKTRREQHAPALIQQGNMNPVNMNMNRNSNGFPNQMPQSQMPNMNMPQQGQQNDTLNPQALMATPMQPTHSQNGNQQPNAMQQTPNMTMGQPQMQGPTSQEIQQLAFRYMGSLTEEKKSEIRNNVVQNWTETQRQQAAAQRRDPVMHWLMGKAKNELMNRRQQAQIAQMQNLQMQQNGGQQGNGNIDFSAIIANQANALKLQESGEQVVPASNNSNVPFNGNNNQMSTPNPQAGNSINPAMLGNNNMGIGNANMQPPPGSNQQQILQWQIMQLQARRQQEQVEQANRTARQQAVQQVAGLQGQPGGLNTPNALNGAAGGSPAMSMLNRPMQPPGSQTPNTPQQPNKAPNMGMPNGQQPGQMPVNGANALLQHHQNMLNRNGQNMGMQGGQANQAQLNRNFNQLLSGMPPAAREKLSAMPQHELNQYLIRYAQQQSQNQNQNQGQHGVPPNMQNMGNQQQLGGQNGMNGMPDLNMPQQQVQPPMPPGMSQAQMQARLQQHQQQQFQQQQQQPQDQQQGGNNAPQHPMVAQMRNQAMMVRPFPPQILGILGMPVLQNVNTWGALRAHISQNQHNLPQNTMQKFAEILMKWFQSKPQELQEGLRMVAMRNQQAQNGNQPGQMNMGMGMPNGAQAGGAPTAQMLQPPQMPQQQLQQGQGQGPGQMQGMRPGQGQLTMPPMQPSTPNEIAMARQKMGPQAQQLNDSQVGEIIARHKRKQYEQQQNALRTAQQAQNMGMPNMQGNPAQQPMRTPQPNAGQPQMPQVKQQQQQPQPGQNKRPPPSQAPSNSNDDLMEIPNPNATANASVNAAQKQQHKIPQMTSEQLSKLNPNERAEMQKRFDFLRQANQGSFGGVQAPVNQNQNAVGGNAAARSQQQQQQAGMPNNAAAIPVGTEQEKLRRWVAEASKKQKGPAAAVDPSDLNEAVSLLRKMYDPYSQVDSTFVAALKTPVFSEDRIRNIIHAKFLVFHNWDKEKDAIREPLSLSLREIKQIHGLIQSYLADLKHMRERGVQAVMQQRLAQQQQAQAQGQAQNQAQNAVQRPASKAAAAAAAVNAKQPPNQTTPAAQVGVKHNRKASSSKPPAAPTENKTFDWGAPSPHGIPKYDATGNQLTPDKLRMPPSKKRRTGQPDSAESTPAGQAGTPGAAGASPGVKAQSPEQMRKAQAQAQAHAIEEDKRRWKCNKDSACDAAITGFETEEELKTHFETVHKEIDDPFQFLLDSAAQTLGTDVQGNVLPSKIPETARKVAKPMPKAATAMKRELSHTPGVKQEIRTPAMQGITPTTPASGNKVGLKAAAQGQPTAAAKVKPAAQSFTLRESMANKLGYPALTSAYVPDTSAGADFMADLGLDLADNDGLMDFDYNTAEDWGFPLVLPEDPSSSSDPETSPDSRASDVSVNDRLRINFEWDAFGNGDTGVPEILKVGEIGLESPPVDLDGKAGDDPFDWSADFGVGAAGSSGWEGLMEGEEFVLDGERAGGDGGMVFEFET